MRLIPKSVACRFGFLCSSRPPPRKEPLQAWVGGNTRQKPGDSVKEEGAAQVPHVNIPARPPGPPCLQQHTPELPQRWHVSATFQENIRSEVCPERMPGAGAPGQTCRPKSLDSRPEDGRCLSLEVSGLPGEHGSIPGRCQVPPSIASGKNPFPHAR